MDTSPDASGTDVSPLIHESYEGVRIELPGGAVINPVRSPALRSHIYHDLITSDGSTLLESDDTAGVAIITQLADDLLAEGKPRLPVRICFTVDEEVGHGVEKLDLERWGQM